MNIANRILGEVWFVTDPVVDWVDIFTCPRPVGYAVVKRKNTIGATDVVAMDFNPSQKSGNIFYKIIKQ